jgi:hypothetical protein
VQRCSNKEIGDQLNISPRTVKQHLRTLFLRAGIRDGRKRVKLARSVHEGDSVVMTPWASLNLMESQISILVWEAPDQSRNWQDRRHQRTNDQEPVAQRIWPSGGGMGRLPETSRPNSSGMLDRSIPIPDMP